MRQWFGTSSSAVRGNRAALPVLVLVSLGAALPVLSGRVLGGHDIVTYLINAQQTAANLREGLVFPAWAGGFNSGYGSPTLLFYPPLTSYIHGFPILFGLPIASSVAVLVVVAHVLSGIALWLWARSAGLQRGALPAAVIYMVAPYRFVDIYLRSALSEHWAFIWPPLILLVAGSSRLNRKSRIALMAVLVAALLLTNLPLAMLFGMGLALWFLISSRLQGRRLETIIGAALGFALSAFQLVPQAMSGSLLDLERYYGPGSERFKPSANTLFKNGISNWDSNTEFSLCVLATMAIILVAYTFLTRVQRRSRSVRLILAAAFVCLAATSALAGSVWDAAPLLSAVQFPWRLSAVMTLLAAAMVAHMNFRQAAPVIVIALLLAAPFANWDRTAERSAFSSEKPQSSCSSGEIFPDPCAAWEAGSGGWYWRHHTLAEIWLVPKAMKQMLLYDLAGQDVSLYRPLRQRALAMSDGSPLPVTVRHWGQVRRELAVDASEAGDLLWRLIAFPGHHLTVDGQSSLPGTDSATGLVSQRVAQGHHVVSWTWKPFPALRRARAVSSVSAVVIALLLVSGLGTGFRRRQHERRGNEQSDMSVSPSEKQ